MGDLGLCECGCGGVTAIAKGTDRARGQIAGKHVRFIQGHHNKVRPLQMLVCVVCGATVPRLQRTDCCSRECADKFRATAWALRKAELPWKIRPNYWKRIKCVVCDAMHWRKRCSKAKTCSKECTGVYRGIQGRVIPLDRERLYELFVVRGWSYRKISTYYFGRNTNGMAVKRSLNLVGLSCRGKFKSERIVIPVERLPRLTKKLIKEAEAKRCREERVIAKQVPLPPANKGTVSQMRSRMWTKACNMICRYPSGQTVRPSHRRKLFKLHPDVLQNIKEAFGKLCQNAERERAEISRERYRAIWRRRKAVQEARCQ